MLWISLDEAEQKRQAEEIAAAEQKRQMEEEEAKRKAELKAVCVLACKHAPVPAKIQGTDFFRVYSRRSKRLRKQRENKKKPKHKDLRLKG